MNFMSGHQEKVQSSHLVNDDDWDQYLNFYLEKLDADHLSNSMICAPYDDLEKLERSCAPDEHLSNSMICTPSYDDSKMETLSEEDNFNIALLMRRKALDRVTAKKEYFSQKQMFSSPSHQLSPPSYSSKKSPATGVMIHMKSCAPCYNYVEKLEPAPVSNSMILVPSNDDDLEILRKEQEVEDKPLFSTSIEVRARGQSSKFLNIAWSRVFPSSKKIEKEEYEKCMQESFCSKLPSSTYGYLINDLLSQENHKINFKQHSSAAVVVAFQLTMVGYLWNSS